MRSLLERVTGGYPFQIFKTLYLRELFPISGRGRENSGGCWHECPLYVPMTSPLVRLLTRYAPFRFKAVEPLASLANFPLVRVHSR